MVSQFRALQPSLRRRRWLAAFALGIVAVYLLCWLALLGRVGPDDFDQFLVFHELQYWNATLFGLAKQWSPVMCSGLSLAGEPQVPFMSLSMLLSYALGPIAGLDVALLLYFLIGWVGAYCYASLWLPHHGQRLLAASLFIGNGFFFCRYGFGHVDFVPFLALPLMLWSLHRARHWLGAGDAATRFGTTALALLLAGAGVAVIVDGSPVAIIHLLYWVCLYAAMLAIVTRSAVPLVALVLALALAALLDAGYLWPMVQAQQQFPRHLPDSFTNPLSLLWFMVMPVLGKLIVPATGNGHELSVFIGPLLFWLLWRYRRRLLRELPDELRWPLLVVSAVAVLLGIGSLQPLHVPMWLSPFDLLRPLPGFRSLFVTGRFWGFLALPLSLGAAAALWRLATVHGRDRGFGLWLGLVAFVQCGFQAETILYHWLPGRVAEPIEFRPAFRDGADEINYVTLHDGLQGRLIRPTQGVINCYDNDDFIHASISDGHELIRSTLPEANRLAGPPPIVARFMSWNRIRVELPPRGALALATDDASQLRIVFNQAYHPLWTSGACTVSEATGNDLQLNCPLARLRQGPVDVEFHDEVSALAADTSKLAWAWWLLAFSALLALRAWASGRGASTSPP
jgi:hypothetical protein